MQLSPSEISDLIKSRIESFDTKVEARTEGTVVSLTDGILRIHGLADVMQGEMIELPGDTYAIALNLERDSVGAVVLGSYKHLSEGDTAKCTGRILEVPIGEALLGRVVDALGLPIDGKGPIDAKETAPIEKIAPGVIERKSVDQPVQTGLKSIDSMVPIGRGQRELIIGDRQTGKTAVAIDTSSTRPNLASNVSMSRLGRKPRRSRTSCAGSSNTMRCSTPSSSPRPRLNLPRCNISLRTPAAPWVSISATTARTR